MSLAEKRSSDPCCILNCRYVIIKRAFTEEKAEQWMENIWVRLGLDPNDKSTWHSEKIHMPWQRREEVATFAPKVGVQKT